MAKKLTVIGVTALAIIASVIDACEIKVHHYNAAFSQVEVGDPEATVVARIRATAGEGGIATTQRYCGSRGMTVIVPMAFCVAAELNESRLFSVRS
jgi:hypothetical protein